MGLLFGQLISRLKLATSPSEREEILFASVASRHVFTCQQLDC
ncbi:hypothetical protein GBAR_LOCUS24701 [Geodia barretti]|uniref:Uncharacterized protein n=1 Tax=Geodia barretti TaxID=519541 RepID=A0AA35TA65_GEOBA|nr:hypothetical protein GBAR_LOCUS16930 [Geodia barretti]CAI8044565.1 hypothetical protein GBAR_LOCUS24701 [Geodia barretti]